MSDLVLELKDHQNRTPVLAGGAVMMTPSFEPDYWTYRVKLSGKQAIVGFPKFSTIGIGFAVEEDCNTNFPYTCTTDEIWQHIKHNKGDASIADEACIRAIDMVREAAAADRDGTHG